MKNILFLICNLAAIAFVFAFLFAVANLVFGLHLGFRGAKIPGDPLAAVAFLVVAGVFGSVTYFLNKKNLTPQE
jgi:hypothetical protein